MAESKIEWTDRSDWNPVRGCTRVSPGCGGPGDHGGCYAEAMAARFSKPGMWGHGFAEMKDGKPRWTGKVELQEDRLLMPFKWRGPARVFPNSTSDFFHEALSNDEIDLLVCVMALNPHLDFQVLTKRADRMRDYMCAPDRKRIIAERAMEISDRLARAAGTWKARLSLDHFSACFAGSGPFRNIWLGVSAERQQEADERIPLLLQTPAAVRFVSAEPLLGPIDVEKFFHHPNWIHWIITGGESGPKARPMNPQWARDIRDQCASFCVAFFHKQNGEFVSVSEVEGAGAHHSFPDGRTVRRVGKKAAGRLLDGVEHNEFPIRARSAGSLPLTIAGNEPGGRAGAVSPHIKG